MVAIVKISLQVNSLKNNPHLKKWFFLKVRYACTEDVLQFLEREHRRSKSFPLLYIAHVVGGLHLKAIWLSHHREGLRRLPGSFRPRLTFRVS